MKNGSVRTGQAGRPPAASRRHGPSVDIAAVMDRVSKAAAPFESRWSLRSLRRVDRELYDRLVEQQDLYHQALVTRDSDEVMVQAAAMCRGWAAVTQVMEEAAVEDDAYQIGRCPKTGTVIAIGENRHTIDRVRDVHGARVIWLTPDEIATLFAGIEGFKTIAAVKQHFPGAEVVDLHPAEPAKEDQ